MTDAAKLALLKQLTATTATDAVLTSFLNVAGQAILNKLYPYDDYDVDRIVKSTEMVNDSYTIAAQPAYPCNITVTATAEDTADTMGTVTITGLDKERSAQTEVITPVAGRTVDGTSIFSQVFTAVGSGWSIDAVEASNDLITVGVGNLKAVPTKHDYKQCQIAAYLVNKQGAEGQIGHSENGISRTYECADIPESMLRDIVPFAGVHT